MNPRCLLSACILTLSLCVGFALAQDDHIVVALSSDVNNWNPARTSTSIDSGIVENVYEKLVDFDRNANPVPALALSWENVQPNVWEFALRPNVVFTNGEVFNADVVKKNLEHQRDDPQNSSRSWLADIVEVEVIDDLTIRIHTHTPGPELVNQLSWTGYMIPLEHGYEQGEYSDRIIENAVGTGPYKLVSWRKDDRIVLEYNDLWWGEEPDIKRVEIRVQPEPVTRVASLLSGEVDFVDNPSAEDIEMLRNTDGIDVTVSSSQRVAYLFMDSFREVGGDLPDGTPGIRTGQPNPLTDVRVRQAMYQAIDRELIAEELHEGLAIPAYQVMLRGTYAYADEVTPHPYDPEAAKALMEEAGYGDGFSIEIAALAGRLPNDQETVLVVANQLAAIGIRASVRPVPPAIAFPAYQEFEMTMGLQSWGALTMPGMSAEGILYGDAEEGRWGRQNHGRFTDPDINRVLDELANETNQEAREALFAELGELFMERVPVLPLYYTTNIRAMKDHLTYETTGLELIYYKDIELR